MIEIQILYCMSCIIVDYSSIEDTCGYQSHDDNNDVMSSKHASVCNIQYKSIVLMVTTNVETILWRIIIKAVMLQ